ncbi:Fic family protein [Facilibium subflavum]|uniref:Fic family protein n=1 Tax=Facilibium subflavum TaxID=2219058 RepID=UPI000E6464DB|nr:Fic family protein [Facilibium subflavum]
MLSFELTDELKTKVKEVNNKFVSLYASLKNINDDEILAIKKYSRISTIGASTRIENAVLTNSEIDWIDTILTVDGKTTAFDAQKHLIENKLSKDRERSIEEVAGCRSMLLRIYHDAKLFMPLREIDIRGLHTELMSPHLKSSPYVGNYKIQSNSVVETNKITGEVREIFKTADAGIMTQTAMHELVSWYNQAIINEAWTIPVICEFVYRFLAIHPFQDGNGRLGRGLFLLGLLQSNDLALASLTPLISIDRQIERCKEEYYFVLNSCSNGKYTENTADYKIEYFLRFMLKMISRSISDVDVYRRKYSETKKLSESSSKILDCFKEYPEVRLTTKMIAEYTELPQRTVSHNLAILTKHELIQKYGRGSATRYQLTF